MKKHEVSGSELLRVHACHTVQCARQQICCASRCHDKGRGHAKGVHVLGVGKAMCLCDTIMPCWVFRAPTMPRPLGTMSWNIQPLSSKGALAFACYGGHVVLISIAQQGAPPWKIICNIINRRLG
ncbi:hypothetical protein HAX54_034509, partial [Datura stramonium]|nr:hypothetical protein [Datura stramonium]